MKTALKFYCKNCKTKTKWNPRSSVIGRMYVWACDGCERELLLPGDKQRKKRKVTA